MLAILSSHPIQYQAPLWQALAADGRVPFEVWYATDHGVGVSHDREFGKSFAWDIDTLAGYRYRFLEAAPGATPGSFWKCRLTENLQARLEDRGARVLWIQGWQIAAYWQAAFSARRAGVDLWLRGESNDLQKRSALHAALKRPLLQAFFRRVDRFLYIGSANRRLYESYGVRAEQLRPARYAVDNERFARKAAELAPSRADIRRRWGIASDAYCVLFCGKFISKKRPEDLVRAAHILHARGDIPNLHLIFAGSGELGGTLREQCAVRFDAENPGVTLDTAATHEWRPPASLTGFLNQTEISQAYVAADCLVLPSDSGETWGLVVNEAMASSLPCAVSTDCGCAEDLAAAPEWTFPVGDAAAMARSIMAIFSNANAQRLLEAPLAAHSMKMIVEEIVKSYAQVTGTSPARDNNAK